MDCKVCDKSLDDHCPDGAVDCMEEIDLHWADCLDLRCNPEIEGEWTLAWGKVEKALKK